MLEKIIFVILLLIIFNLNLFTYKKLPKRTKNVLYKTLSNTIKIFRTNYDLIIDKEMYKNCHEEWFRLNNNIEMLWFNNYDCDKFMKTQNKRIYNAYKILIPGAFKADLFRLCILYKYGGVYADSQTKPFISIKKMINLAQNCSFISVLDSKFSGGGIHNGFIISKPQHPFLKKCIENILNNVKNKRYTNHMLGVTGPLCLYNSIYSFNNNINLGLNICDDKSLNFYLFKFSWGPYQYIYENNIRLLSKKYSFFTYIYEKLKKTSYEKLWKNKNIYNI
jgi:mannosyltransferase OCH1-like enzyme